MRCSASAAVCFRAAVAHWQESLAVCRLSPMPDLRKTRRSRKRALHLCLIRIEMLWLRPSRGSSQTKSSKPNCGRRVDGDRKTTFLGIGSRAATLRLWALAEQRRPVCNKHSPPSECRQTHFREPSGYHRPFGVRFDLARCVTRHCCARRLCKSLARLSVQGLFASANAQSSVDRGLSREWTGTSMGHHLLCIEWLSR